MIIETAIIAKVVGAKIAAAHAAHALAAKEAFAVHHPLTATVDTAIHYGIDAFMSEPAIPITTKFAVSAAMHQGAPLTWHTAAKIATPVVTGVAWQEFRESELYQQTKETVRELFNEPGIRQQNA
jgi:hypothetical protein